MDSSRSLTPSTTPHNSSSSSMAALKTNKICPICLNSIDGHRSAILTACYHSYCLRCLLRWSNYKRSCPLCNSLFDSYFSPPSSRRYRLHPLLPPPPDHSPVSRPHRILRRTRGEINVANPRSRPVPRLRSFGQLSSVPAHVIQERILQWRASVYKCGLRAIPFQERNLNLNRMMSNRHREEILHRIEPWIRRELQAVLQDLDPTVIVHVATSIYLSNMEKKTTVNLVSSDTVGTFLAPLRPFLGDWSHNFWHELRCFAESSYTMDTYDEVVDYTNSEEC